MYYYTFSFIMFQKNMYMTTKVLNFCTYFIIINYVKYVVRQTNSIIYRTDMIKWKCFQN